MDNLENIENNDESVEQTPVAASAAQSKATDGVGKTRKPIRVSLGVLIACILLTGILVFQATFVALTQQHKRDLNEAYGQAAEFDKMLEVAELYKKYYMYDIDPDAMRENMARAYALFSGDKYTSYYTAAEYLEAVSSSAGNSVGIGVYVVMSATDNMIEVVHVMANSPAEVAGVQKGDVITAIGGVKVSDVGYEAAVDLVRGEKGSVVTLEVTRDGSKLTIDVVRGDYTAETVLSEMIEVDGKKIGYIRITEFMQVTVTQFKNAVRSLMNEGAEGFIFDVRNNPGGELSAICNILDFLLQEGPIVHIIGAASEREVYTSDASEIDLPMVVLANGSTASAAELFTSALKDYEKAQVIGTLTYGKGCGQEGFYLSDGSVLYITSFFYNPPFSDNYDGIGITPDIEIEMPEELQNTNLFLVAHDVDVQLQQAIKVLISQ